MRTETAIPTRLADYVPFPFSVNHVHMAFALHPERTLVTTTVIFHRVPGMPGDADLFLDGEDLELVSIRLDGADLPADRYDLDASGLTVRGLGDRARLETVVAINPSANTKLSGLYVSGGRFCTQCEAEGFRRITFWPDRPDVMAEFVVRLEADAADCPVLLSNGNPVAAGMLDETRHFAEWHDPWTKPAYLFALVAGQLDSIEDRFVCKDGRKVELTIYVDPGAGSRALYAMDALKRAMAWDEEVFGLVYDLDVFNIVAVSDFNFGAMENKGLNIFNSALLLADAQTATDTDFELIEAVVAHEYFHNWSGNRVTCRDWFQLSLKEGLTVFRDQQFSADMRSAAVKRIQDVRRLRARQFQEDAGPLAHPVRPASYVKIDNFYTATIYEKGAEVIRVARNMLGATRFMEGCVRYFTDNDGRAATIEDWLTALRGADESALEGIETWYAQAGTPVLSVASHHDPVARTLALTLRQHTPPTPGQPDKRPVPIPVHLGFLAPDGRPMMLQFAGMKQAADTFEINFGAPEATLHFENVLQRPVLSVLRGFSAPVRLETDHTLDDLALLAAHDTDPFNRWEAAQTLARRCLLSVAAGRDDAGGLEAAMQVVFAHALAGATADPAYAALLLTLPDVGELMQLEPGHKPAVLAAARAGLKSTLSAALDSQLRTALSHYDRAAPFSPDAGSAGRRAFHGAVLDLLCSGSSSDGPAVAFEAFDSATNMTDSMAALSALAIGGGPLFDTALGMFEARWHGTPLVMDKWFAVRAAAPSGDPLSVFGALRQHPAFTLANPNRVRALAAPFALRNPAAFHREDGEGYAVLARLIADVDARNPALAATLCKLMESAGLAHADNRAAAARVLDALSSGRALSPNTLEILSKVREGLG